ITSWFRTEAYYASGGWRATWEGEGGGVLLNQCPHNLDLMQWLTGMPTKVMGFCNLGKRHTIEVEDEVTAYLEYENGATGTFITSTGEAPGENRLTIAGERGKLVVEGSSISFTRTEEPVDEFLKTSKKGFAQPGTWNIDIPFRGDNLQHVGILRNYIDAILDGADLIAPAAEGIRSVELSNAMLYSSMTGKPVDMPLDGEAYEKLLKKLIEESTFEKQTTKEAADEDLNASFMK
ncbi:MAG: Gfo/Idh/MocA family protein, partial [Candidatus Sumerlaeota bacterium]